MADETNFHPIKDLRGTVENPHVFNGHCNGHCTGTVRALQNHKDFRRAPVHRHSAGTAFTQQGRRDTPEGHDGCLRSAHSGDDPGGGDGENDDSRHAHGDHAEYVVVVSDDCDDDDEDVDGNAENGDDAGDHEAVAGYDLDVGDDNADIADDDEDDDDDEEEGLMMLAILTKLLMITC